LLWLWNSAGSANIRVTSKQAHEQAPASSRVVQPLELRAIPVRRRDFPHKVQSLCWLLADASLKGGHFMKTFALRLPPGAELKASLQAFVGNKDIQASFVLACVGSVKQVKLRLANAKPSGSADEDIVEFKDKCFEIVSLQATFAANGDCHMHVALADETGATIGGHVISLIVHTTAEIVMGDVSEEHSFTRAFDPTTGYKELVIKPRL
jgi:predicted DNA-binding protein with PD1-like motif